MGRVLYGNSKYYAVYMPNREDADKKGYIYEHRLIAEQIVHRRLKRTEYVHHKDENGLNNDISNLMVFASNSDHTAYHNGSEIYCVDNVWYAKFKRPKCKKCGKSLDYKSKTGLCIECYKKYLNEINNIPSKEQLQRLLSENNYSAIGRMYNVSGNAVKKWAKKYGIYNNCFRQLPDKNSFIQFMNTHNLAEARKNYDVDRTTILSWCKKFGVTHIKSYQIQCVETGEIFESGREVIRKYLPNENPKVKAEILRRAITNKTLFLGYHWVEILT